MSDKPIILRGPMVRAILTGRKTQARMLMPHQKALSVAYAPIVCGNRIFNYSGEEEISKSRYAVGDQLWVREAWADQHPLAIQDGRYSQQGRAGIPGPPGVKYRTIYRIDGEPLQIWRSYEGHPYDHPWTVSGAIEVGYSEAEAPAYCVKLFREWVSEDPKSLTRLLDGGGEAKLLALKAALPRIRGHNLACFCRHDAPCHADVLLEFANR